MATTFLDAEPHAPIPYTERTTVYSNTNGMLSDSTKLFHIILPQTKL